MRPEKRERVLDTNERMSEILFGLIMVLSFTCTMSVATEEGEDLRTVLIAALTCNVAWGIIDAVMYLMAVLVERGRGLVIARAVRSDSDPAQGRRVISAALPEPFDTLLDDADVERVRAKLVSAPELPARARLSARDWAGAFGVFLLVFLSTFPVTIPFLIFSELHTAMRVSNGVAIVLLYVMGHVLGRHAGLSALRTGLVMVAVGVVLVGLTIALGG